MHGTHGETQTIPQMCMNLATLTVDVEFSRPLEPWPTGMAKLPFRSEPDPEIAGRLDGRDLSAVARHLHEYTTASKRQAREYLFHYCLGDFDYRGPIDAGSLEEADNDAISKDEQWRMNYKPSGKCLDPQDWDTIVECGNEYMKKRDMNKSQK